MDFGRSGGRCLEYAAGRYGRPSSSFIRGGFGLDALLKVGAETFISENVQFAVQDGFQLLTEFDQVQQGPLYPMLDGPFSNFHSTIFALMPIDSAA